MDQSQWKQLERLWERAAQSTKPDIDALIQNDPSVPPEVAAQFRQLWAAAQEDQTQKLAASLASDAVGAIDAAVDERMIHRCFGAYEISGRIGQGGSGAVYVGRREQDGVTHLAAVKVLTGAASLDSRRLSEFSREQQSLARLNHPFITQYIDSGVTEDGFPFVIQEYVDGCAITEYADSNVNSLAEMVGLLEQLCLAVDYAHRNLIVHCDLKPSNILVAQETGTPKVLDFGIAKPLAETGVSKDVTTSFSCTPNFASPEQIERHQRISTATDIYSLGVVMFRCFAGVAPYSLNDNTVSEMLAAMKTHRAGNVFASQCRERWPGLDKAQAGELAAVVNKAMAFRPEDRYATAREMAADLLNVMAFRPITAKQDAWGYRLSRFVRRNRLAVFVTSTIFLLAIAGAIVFAMQSQQIKQQSQRYDSVSQILTDILAAPDPYERGRDAKMIDVLDAARERLAGLENTDPEVVRRVSLVLGRTYLGLGELETSRELLEAAQPPNRGPGDADNAEWERQWAGYLIESGDFSAGLEAIKKVKSFHQDQESIEDLPYAEAVLLEAEATALSGSEYELAYRLAKEAEELVAGLSGQSANEIDVQAQQVQAYALAQQSKFEDAIRLQRDVVAQIEVELGAQHPFLFNARNNLARYTESAGDLQEAQNILQANAFFARDTFGEQAPKTLMALNNLGVNAFRQKEFRKASLLFEEVYRGRSAVLGETHRRTQMVRTNYADALLLDGQLDAACATAQQAYQVMQKHESENHYPGFPLKVLGKCLRDQGQFEQAREHLNTVYRLFRDKLGEQNWNTFSVMHDLAVLEARAGEFTRAEVLANTELEGLTKMLGAEHARTIRAQELLDYLGSCPPDCQQAK